MPEPTQSLRQVPAIPGTSNRNSIKVYLYDCAALGIPFLAGIAVGEAPPASRANSPSGVLNCEDPQSMHTKTLGNRRIPGLSRFFRPRKWRFTSATNSAWRLDAHDGQLMMAPLVAAF